MRARKGLFLISILALVLVLSVSIVSAQDAVTLRVMHWGDNLSGQTDWWNEILQGFEDAHPGVTIENNYVPFAQYLPSLEAMIAGEELPDVFWGHVKAAELGRGGLIVNWSDIVDEAYLSQFYPGPLKQFTFDGNVYAIPWTAQIFGVFVNPAIMDELGLEPPQTWDELMEMAPKITAAGYIPLVWGNAENSTGPDFFLPLITQEGGDVYALDDLSDPDVSWNSEPVVKALTLLKQLNESGAFVPAINGVGEDQANQLWYQGRAAMMYNGSWAIDSIRQDAPEELVNSYFVTKVPALTTDAPHWTGDGSGEGWVVKANSPNTDLGVEFVKYILSSDVYAKHITATQNMPSIPAALDSVENKFLLEMTSWLESDGTDHILFGAGSWEAIASGVTGVLDGSLSPEDAAAQIQADVMATRNR